MKEENFIIIVPKDGIFRINDHVQTIQPVSLRQGWILGQGTVKGYVEDKSMKLLPALGWVEGQSSNMKSVLPMSKICTWKNIRVRISRNMYRLFHHPRHFYSRLS